MGIKQVLHKLNAPIVIIHFFATLLAIGAALHFSVLSDIELVEGINKYGTEFHRHLNSTGSLGQRLTTFMYLRVLFELIAIVFTCLISWQICIKLNISVYNTILVFLLTLIVNQKLFKLTFVKYCVSLFGEVFFNFNLINTHITNGVFLSLIAITILFLSYLVLKPKYVS